MAPTTGMASYRITRSELKQLVNLHLNDVVIRMWNKHIRDLDAAGTPFASKEELPLFSGTDDTSASEFFEFMIKKLEGNFSAYHDKIRECAANLEKMYDAQELLQLFHEQVHAPPAPLRLVDALRPAPCAVPPISALAPVHCNDSLANPLTFLPVRPSAELCRAP